MVGVSDALFDLSELQAPLATVNVDPKCQHIVLATDDHPAAGAYVDLGPELHWWSSFALHLDPTGARELGHALIAWADRRQR